MLYDILFLEQQGWCWQSLDKTASLPLLPDGGIKYLKKNFDLCVTGEVRGFFLFLYILKNQDAGKQSYTG